MSLKAIDKLPADIRMEIDRLNQQGASESTICKEIFTTLLNENNCKAICTYLKMVEAIPEDVLVKILTHLLNSATENPRKNNSTLYSYINLVLDTTYTDIFLQEYLKQISVKNTKMLFKYLVDCLDSNPALSPEKYLSANKIFDWLCILLDAQYHTITLSSDREFSDILDRLNESLKLKFWFLDELEKLEAILGSINSSPVCEKDNRNLPYCIEKLVIQ